MTKVDVDTVTEIIEQQLNTIEKRIERGETAYENPECPHCGREMEWGGSSNDGITYGCYPPMGEGREAREKYDCPHYQDHGSAYATTKQTHDVNALKRARGELATVKLRIQNKVGE